MKELATAMAKAQSEIKSALKDSKNPHFKSSYADLTSVWDACRAALTKNGLSVVQVPGFDENDVWLETMILHASGESISGRYPLRPQPQTPQGYGSALTYARRYSLAAMVGVVADEDDDGNAASERGRGEPVQPPVPANAKAFVTRAIAELGAITAEDGIDAWIADNKDKLDKLKTVHPDGHAQIIAGAAEQRKAVTK